MLSGFSKDVSVDGAFGEAGANFGDMIDITANYQYLTGFKNILTGKDKTNQRFIARGELLPKALEHVSHLSKAVAYYEKDNIGVRDDGFFERTPDTFYGYKLGMDLSESVMILWDTRFTFITDQKGDIETRKIISFETVVKF